MSKVMSYMRTLAKLTRYSDHCRIIALINSVTAFITDILIEQGSFPGIR